MNDTTRTKFVTLAQKRMNRAIKAIREVGKLGNQKRALSGSDISQINAKLLIEVEAAQGRLLAGLDIQPDFRLGTAGEE